LRALAVMYIRLTFRPVDVYEILEPLLKDYRKLRHRDMGSFLPFLSVVINCYRTSQTDIH